MELIASTYEQYKTLTVQANKLVRAGQEKLIKIKWNAPAGEVNYAVYKRINAYKKNKNI